MSLSSLILLPEALHSDRLDWMILSATGEKIEEKCDSHFNDLPKDIQAYKIITLLPGQEVSLIQITLPKLSSQKLRQAIPYALEDKVIDDIQTLHFATGSYEENGTYPVAVITKEKMQQWINFFRQFNIDPHVMTPLTLAVPYDENKPIIYHYRNQAIYRTGKYTGITMSLSQMGFLSIEHQEITITQIANCISDNVPINLLQPPFAIKRNNTRLKNLWKPATYLALTWMGVIFLSHFISFIILHFQSASLSYHVNQIYTKNFPHATSISAPHERMASKIKELTLAANKNNFLILLATVGRSFTSGLKLHHLDYRDGVLSLDVSTANFETIDQFIQHLIHEGLTTKQQNSSVEGTEVKARLLINAGTA